MTMQNIKNFKQVCPSKEQVEKYKREDGVLPIFLQSEDGQDWYECQSLFADDTVKIMYADDGTILSVVDAPVPERGNIYAVSMFYPLNLSVAEIAVKDYPESIELGSWVFDGKAVTKRQPTQEELIAEAENTKTALMSSTSTTIGILQDAVDLGDAAEEEAALLIELRKYRVKLNRVDPTKAPDIDWPDNPS